MSAASKRIGVTQGQAASRGNTQASSSSSSSSAACRQPRLVDLQDGVGDPQAARSSNHVQSQVHCPATDSGCAAADGGDKYDPDDEQHPFTKARRRREAIALIIALALVAVGLGLGFHYGIVKKRVGVGGHVIAVDSSITQPAAATALEQAAAAQLSALMQVRAVLDPMGVLDAALPTPQQQQQPPPSPQQQQVGGRRLQQQPQQQHQQQHANSTALPAPFCRWNWVQCDSSRQNVTALVTPRGVTLAGQLPSHKELAALPALRKIVAPSAGLTGTLPPDWAKLQQLQWVDLHNNTLNGTLPPLWGSLPQLERLLLGSNQLEGPLPQDLKNLTAVTVVRLGNNRFQGQVPVGWASMPRLQDLDLSSNRLTGPLPVQWGGSNHMPQLQVLNLSSNQLTGQVPASWGEWKSIRNVSLANMTATQAPGQCPLPHAWRNASAPTALFSKSWLSAEQVKLCFGAHPKAGAHSSNTTQPAGTGNSTSPKTLPLAPAAQNSASLQSGTQSGAEKAAVQTTAPGSGNSTQSSPAPTRHNRTAAAAAGRNAVRKVIPAGAGRRRSMAIPPQPQAAPGYSNVPGVVNGLHSQPAAAAAQADGAGLLSAAAREATYMFGASPLKRFLR